MEVKPQSEILSGYAHVPTHDFRGYFAMLLAGRMKVDLGLMYVAANEAFRAASQAKGSPFVIETVLRGKSDGQ
jgi:hypothetical protein